MLEFIQHIMDIDTQMFFWVNTRHCALMDVWMPIVSGRFIWVPLYVIMLYAVYLSYGIRTTLLMGLMIIIAVAMADQICASGLRPIFERLRPAHLDNPIYPAVHIIDGYRGGKYGFPSCHAANTFACVALTSMAFRRWQFTIFVALWALTVCYSRMYLGVHYPGDLIAGSLIGLGCGFLCYELASVAIRIFIFSKPWKREAHRIVATYKRGAPLIHSRIMQRDITWRPTALPIFTGVATFAGILIYALIVTY